MRVREQSHKIVFAVEFEGLSFGMVDFLAALSAAAILDGGDAAGVSPDEGPGGDQREGEEDVERREDACELCHLRDRPVDWVVKGLQKTGGRSGFLKPSSLAESRMDSGIPTALVC